MRVLQEKDETIEKLSDSSSDISNDFSKLHLKAPSVNKSKNKKKLFNELLGFAIDSHLDLKLV